MLQNREQVNIYCFKPLDLKVASYTTTYNCNRNWCPELRCYHNKIVKYMTYTLRQGAGWRGYSKLLLEAGVERTQVLYYKVSSKTATWSNMKKGISSHPDQCGSVSSALSHKAKSHQSGHMSGLRVSPGWSAYKRKLIGVSLPLFLSPPSL